MGGLGRLQLLDHQTHMLPHLRHLDLVGGHIETEAFSETIGFYHKFQRERPGSVVLGNRENRFRIVYLNILA